MQIQEVFKMGEETAIDKMNNSRVVNIYQQQKYIEAMIFSDSHSFEHYVNKYTSNVDIVFWNEEYIAVRSKKGQVIRFRPELNEDLSPFFKRKNEGKYSRLESWDILWQEGYESVIFSKKDLLQFLKKHVSELEEGVSESIKEMQVKQRLDTKTINLSDDEQSIIENESMETNIPKTFKGKMEIMAGYFAEITFRATVVRNVSSYGAPKGGHSLSLEILDARKIKREMMQSVLAKLPSDIPMYYGKLEYFTDQKDRL